MHLERDLLRTVQLQVVPASRATDLRRLLNPATLRERAPRAYENVMAKPNYHQARKQRELARKSRQQEKLLRRSTRARAVGAGSQVEPLEDAAAGTPGARGAGGGQN